MLQLVLGTCPKSVRNEEYCAPKAILYGWRLLPAGPSESLRSYLEAQYHIRDVGLIDERHRLLREAASITQRPYVEATPVYEPGVPYAKLKLPDPARALLTAVAGIKGAGVFDPPYLHQAEALEAFLKDGPDRQDLIVATGTGSGKTESFLMPILGALAIERERRPASFALPGCRALLLYPMNALVADQLALIRRLFGHDEVLKRLRRPGPRGVRCDSACTPAGPPYPGQRSGTRDRRYVLPLFEEFYLVRDPKVPFNQPGAFAERNDKVRDELQRNRPSRN